MSEKISNRREVSSAEYEQTDRYRALQYLNQIGITKKINELDLFHGRAGDGKAWQVNPSFNNADNNTGNYNINKISALNTSDYDTANKFSIARAYGDSSLAEVHHIMSDDPDAVIIDSYAFNNLTPEQQEESVKAIGATLIGITEGSPLSFEDRYALNNVKSKDIKNRYGVVFSQDVDKVSEKLNLDPSLVRQIGSSINTRELLKKGYLNKLCRAFVNNQQEVSVPVKARGKDEITNESVPINHEYLANWFRKNHIVGYKTPAFSATLFEDIDNYLLFDLEKVNAENAIEVKQRQRFQKLGKMAYIASKNGIEDRGHLMDALSSNLYIKPEEIIQLAKTTPGFKEVFESDAGNWEKFKLEEHTETVLRVFDDNYADVLPASVLPLMRLALLVHDIGKPEAAKRGDKANQKRYNLTFADKFLKENSIDESTTKLIEAMIGNGMELAERLTVKNDQSVVVKYYDFCENTMKKYLGTEKVDFGTIMGFKNMLEILQTCDSAAYTTMAITRTKNFYYKNHGSFDQSFEPFRGFTGRRAKLK